MQNVLGVDVNDQRFQEISLAVMDDILQRDMEQDDNQKDQMDILYEGMCHYLKVTKDAFVEFYHKAEAQLKEWFADGVDDDTRLLTEEELDYVVGGSFKSFLKKVGNGIKRGASAVGNFVKKNAATIGIVAGCMVLGALTGGAAAVGYFVGTGVTALSTAGGAALGGGIIGSIIGGNVGIYVDERVAHK